jgi:hypothetical protein
MIHSSFKKGGSRITQTLQLAEGNLILTCDEAILVRNQVIVFNGNHIKVKDGQRQVR